MKTRMQLSPKVAPKVKVSRTLVYIAGGLIIATIAGIFIFLQFNLGNSFSSLAASTTFTSKASGNWTTGSVWQNNTSPGADINDNDIVIKSGHSIVRNGNLSGDNNVVVTIEQNATLTINGTLSVDNNMILNNRGTLIITGDLVLNNNANLTVFGGGTMTVGNDVSFDNNATFKVDGSLNVGRNVTFGNNRTFNGEGTVRIVGTGCNRWTGTIPCMSGLALPIELLEFNAEDAGDGTVLISWATAQEKNNDYFTIHRSDDGLNYTEVARVTGSGTVATESRYETRDNTPAAERLYYRLSQTDYDGTTETFAPVMVQVELKTGELKAYPNPMTGKTLTVHLPKSEKAAIQFLDSNGKVILAREADGSANTIDLEFQGDLLQGFYYLKYKSQSGVSQTLKIVKK